MIAQWWHPVMNPNLKGVSERNEAAKAMLTSIHESREKDWAKCLEAGQVAMPEDVRTEFGKLVPFLRDAFETAWMNGVDYGFRLTDKEWGRKARSKFLPSFLARWYTRPPRFSPEDPCKKPLIKYMRARRAGLPENVRSAFDAYSPSMNAAFMTGWRKGMEWGGNFGEVLWTKRLPAELG
jgi:hypothetical protein